MPNRKRDESDQEGSAEGVPDVRAILVSDLHLCQRAPVARSAEEDWFEAMARPLQELTWLVDRHGAPVVYAGDIFDRWNASAEVINFALDHLPPGYAIPGQHDLPNHNYGEIGRSAYWTLVSAKLLEDLKPGGLTPIAEHVCAYGFPWGFPPAPIDPVEGQLNLAVVHAFIYNSKATGYTGVSTGARASVARATLAGFDVAVYGDNHKGFTDTHKGLTIYNSGGFMRRKTDERGARPSVGLLLADGTVRRHYLDISEDSFIELTEAEEAVGKTLDMSAFMAGLEGLGADDALEFEGALRRFLDENQTEAAVRKIVLEAANA